MSLTFADINQLFGNQSNPIDFLEGAKFKNPTTGYRIAKSIRSLRQAFQELNEKRDELIKLYGTDRDEEDKETQWHINSNDTVSLNRFIDDFSKFLEIEPLDLKIYPVSLADMEGVELPASVYVKLWFLFIDPDAESE